MAEARVVRELDRAVDSLRLTVAPKLGIVLGSGLGHLATKLEDATRVPYSAIFGMPEPSVAGHGGALVLGRLGGASVACLSGRVHLYEGHAPERVVFGVRLLARLGVGAVLLTNAAGGIGARCRPGTLLSIRDHLNLTGQSPLAGPNEDELGPRFPDMSRVYDEELRALLRSAASATGVGLEEGVYAGLLGPSYETPAEIRMLEILGADAVGMSTVHEAIALRHMNVRVAGVSCITNWGAGKSDAALSHAEVSEVANRVAGEFGELVTEFCRAWAGRAA